MILAHLEVVESFHVSSDLVDLGVIFLLDITNGLGEFRLPELAVLLGGVTIGKGS